MSYLLSPCHALDVNLLTVIVAVPVPVVPQVIPTDVPVPEPPGATEVVG